MLGSYKIQSRDLEPHQYTSERVRDGEADARSVGMMILCLALHRGECNAITRIDILKTAQSGYTVHFQHTPYTSLATPFPFPVPTDKTSTPPPYTPTSSSPP
ncbi:hypothetical protein B5807_09978 [Epicoccum nigrum]|uniref:Uncharacterized protein n=1 Tax=Epicoccum nigrum TaxID=105696 RepID=A0A1Y2LTD9_EPING|nr:hypothetical protein B5807_09978 [Epicoccum nigrum]